MTSAPSSPAPAGLLFVFDMDDVLYDHDWRGPADRITAATGHDLPELRRRWYNDEGEWAAEAGRFDADAYLAAFCAAVGVELDEAEWVRRRRASMTVRPSALEAVARARAAGRITLLTNNNALAARHLPELARELVPLFGVEHLRTSSGYGARKPDPAVFRGVLDAYGQPAARTFFADDRLDNVESARGLGIHGHHVRGDGDLLPAVEAFIRAQAEAG
jgi:HAD superfamily hydrolase (TIGR01509 family)